MSAHITPGPWHAEKLEDSGDWVIYPHGDEGYICAMDSLRQEERPTENEANALAIAALPELLAVALEIAQSHCDLEYSERRIRLYHALMKAGVPEYQPTGGAK